MSGCCYATFRRLPPLRVRVRTVRVRVRVRPQWSAIHPPPLPPPFEILDPPLQVHVVNSPEVDKVEVVFIHSIEQHAGMSAVYSLPSCLVQELR